jgi:hypothetical protein
MFVHIDSSSVLAGVSLEVIDINLEKPGTYDIILKIFEDIDGKTGELLDEKLAPNRHNTDEGLEWLVAFTL